ncbi:uncharacterized protein LOC118438716 [Folsomia candida]|uniref:Uncharacterized protein n=1 Tax=Folsomia candida TaxID=158441 RepID=A0A226DBN5_FOLCA|nr:uncharacterized protein LOC118438716 [Folsomia candida]OXA42583.1 hypothetical protein Fcan01_22574 [Folsomia candida]
MGNLKGFSRLIATLEYRPSTKIFKISLSKSEMVCFIGDPLAEVTEIDPRVRKIIQDLKQAKIDYHKKLVQLSEEADKVLKERNIQSDEEKFNFTIEYRDMRREVARVGVDCRLLGETFP